MKKFALVAIFLITPFILSGCSIESLDGNASEEKANPNNALWTSIDGGKNWINNSKATGANIAGLDVVSMVVNPYDGNNVFVGTLKNGIFTTADGGENWKNLPFRPIKVYGLALDPIDSRIIYASGILNKRGKIFKSVDGGTAWTEIYTTAAEGPLISALAIDRKNPKIIYAATSEKQLLKTEDGGVSWRNIFTANSPLIKIVFDKENTSLFYAMSLAGDVLRSKDAGANVEHLKTISMGNSGNSSFNALEIDRGIVYVGGRNGIHLSRNAGDNWDEIKTLNDSATYPVRAIAINPTNPREMIYGAAQASYRSLDGGNTWETFQFDLGRNVNVIEYSNDAAKLYLGFRK